MKVGTLLLVIHDVVEELVGFGVLQTNGDFTVPSLNEDLRIAAAVEKALKAHGVDIPEDIDKVLQALPLILSLVK